MGLAELAVRLALRVPGEDGWRARLRGYALAHLAQARFAQGDLDGGIEAFHEAQRLWDEGAPGDPGLLDGTLLQLLAGHLRGDEETAGLDEG